MSGAALGETPAQRRLLEVAVDAFAERGFGGTSTRDIATRAGRSPAALYIHYKTKEDLLFAASLWGHREALGCLQAAFDATRDPARRLAKMIFDFSCWHMENAKLGRVVQYEFHALSDEHRYEITELRRRFHLLMTDALLAGVADAAFEVEDVNAVARALLSMCIDFVRWFDPTATSQIARNADINAALALRMIRPV